MSEENKTKDIIDSVTGLVKEIPIYEDALKPAAKEIGKSLETAAKAINVALGPIRGLIWGYNQIEEFVSTRVAEKMQNVPKENIITPQPNVAGPALEALRFVGHEKVLREMYANLLASAMDSRSHEDAHPSFVNIIKELTPEEAKILKHLSEREEFPDVYTNVWFDKITGRGKYASGYIHTGYAKEIFNDICSKAINSPAVNGVLDNFMRLRLLDYKQDSSQELKETNIEKYSSGARKDFKTSEKIQINITTTESIQFTSFGCQFVKTCVLERI